MSDPGGKSPGIVRLGAVVVLTVAAVLLYILDRHSGEVVVRGSEQISPSARAGIQTIVDSMFNRYGVRRTSVRTWNVLSIERKPIRIAQQIEVPRTFPSLVFNAQMQRMLEPLEAHVFATERSRDNIVTMHIVCRGQTVRSLAFLMTQKED